MKTTLTYLALAVTAIALTTGCATNLHHGKIFTAPAANKGSLGVAERAQNMKEHIGWGTLTIFAIPVAPVTVNGEADKELMNQIKDAVEQAGYQAKIVDGAASVGTMPVLTCNVQKFKFRNYTWLFPIVFNWGTIRLDVAVTAPDGKVLWSKTYTGKGNGMYSFGHPVNKSLTAILNELSTDLANSSI